MKVHLPNEYIDYILRWENRGIIKSKMHKDYFRDGSFSPETHYLSLPFPGTRDIYYTYTWDMGGAPPEVEISIELDRYPPPESGIYHPGGGELHNHDFFEILYVYSGNCNMFINGQEQRLNAGDLCLFNLQCIHSIRKENPEDVFFNILIRRDLFQRSFLDLMAENDLITDFCIQSLFKINNPARHIIISPKAEYRCETILQWMIERYYKSEFLEQSMLKAMLALLLGEMTTQYMNEIVSKDSLKEQKHQLSRVISYISQNYKTITLEMLSAHMGYTTRSMTRYIRANTGMTFKQIVQQIRFSHACILLREGEQSIEAIAEEIGYTERASFDRAFKSMHGITPYEYRTSYHK